MADAADPFIADYEMHCLSCHGAQLNGVPGQGPALLNVDLKYGNTVAELSKFSNRGLHWANNNNKSNRTTEKIQVSRKSDCH